MSGHVWTCNSGFPECVREKAGFYCTATVPELATATRPVSVSRLRRINSARIFLRPDSAAPGLTLAPG
jgi:hypothetical protein